MKPTLLVIDDEFAIRKLLEFYFSKTYNVVTKTTGYEALSWIYDGNAPDAIISDIEMPGLNGRLMIQSIRAVKHTQHTPIVVLSGHETTNERILCLESGADDYLVKPFNPKELEIRLNNLIKKMSVVS